MAYPTKDEFAHLLQTANLRDIVRDHIFGGVPYVFRDAPDDADALVGHLSNLLTIPPENFAIIGSGKIGFSLAPDKFGHAFGSHSDIDVVVVSDALFDSIWFDLLRITRKRFWKLQRRDQYQIKAHMTDIYWGRIWPQRLLTVSQKGERWVEAFRSVARNPRLAFHETNGRLYRSWEHAALYHLDGLSLLARRSSGPRDTTS